MICMIDDQELKFVQYACRYKKKKLVYITEGMVSQNNFSITPTVAKDRMD